MLMVTPVPAAPKSKPKEGSAAPKKEAATPQTEPPTKKMPPAYPGAVEGNQRSFCLPAKLTRGQGPAFLKDQNG